MMVTKNEIPLSLRAESPAQGEMLEKLSRLQQAGQTVPSYQWEGVSAINERESKGCNGLCENSLA